MVGDIGIFNFIVGIDYVVSSSFSPTSATSNVYLIRGRNEKISVLLAMDRLIDGTCGGRTAMAIDGTSLRLSQTVGNICSRARTNQGKQARTRNVPILELQYPHS